MKKLLVAVVAAALALPVAAQSPVLVSKQSGRWGSFQFSLSPFNPNIDSEFNTSPGPYAVIFGTSRPLMFQAMFSGSAWITEAGSLDIGFSGGYWGTSGSGIYFDSTGKAIQGGSTSLTIIPLQLTVGYRVDWFYERFNVPFAPYARFAFIDDIWSSSGQNGVSSWTSDQQVTYRASGATFGWGVTLGLALVLDFLDTQLSRQMDYDTGINRTMLFLDFTKSSVNNFGSSKSWQLAPAYWQWSAGILFVF